jgi:hypothetical protein
MVEEESTSMKDHTDIVIRARAATMEIIGRALSILTSRMIISIIRVMVSMEIILKAIREIIMDRIRISSSAIITTRATTVITTSISGTSAVIAISTIMLLMAVTESIIINREIQAITITRAMAMDI